jgi:phosphomannomutase
LREIHPVRGDLPVSGVSADLDVGGHYPLREPLDHLPQHIRAADARVSSNRDGLTVNLSDGRWVNLRPSNTEPLLRLNVEAPSHEAMTAIRDEVAALVR